MTMLIAMVAKFKYWLTVAAGIFVMLALAFIKGRSNGKAEVVAENKDNEIKAAKEVAVKEVTAAKEAKNVQTKVSSSADVDVDSELQRFTRD